eukprot:CAMPEP_0174855268 /NCGR_PEP_ID=MMETSP1114-20130205/32873_1 /TAXON_ID=312471 /ORGANISM="Neobodo designis, Strain CCAP 1951/1" /LENGTH=138 /DNA_ID=CAMNT_0016090003 /DNA_START=43 /DNA_END=459 /DNA_ORIENTATION=+
MSQKTLVAQLPPMTSADCERFEKEGGVWGQQRAIRRQQVQVMGGVTLATVAAGTFFTLNMRRNTRLVAFCCLPGWATFGAVAGNFLGVQAYPSVACNKETTMMRRVWWAKQCAAGWDMSQVNGDKWAAQYPHAKPINA